MKIGKYYLLQVNFNAGFLCQITKITRKYVHFNIYLDAMTDYVNHSLTKDEFAAKTRSLSPLETLIYSPRESIW